MGCVDNRWRILVGDDAVELDRLVRADPEGAYEDGLVAKMRAAGHFGGLLQDAAD